MKTSCKHIAYSLIKQHPVKMDKETLLQISYRDEQGTMYTDTLSVQELGISKEWANRVERVAVCHTNEVYTGKEAINLLQNLNTITE